jgi:hypothetical protein
MSEADHVERGVEVERVPTQELPQAAGGDEADAEPGERGRLEAGHDAAAQPLVVRGGAGDVAQDRRDAGRRRGALEPAGDAEEEEVGGERRHDDRHRAEDRAVLHHPA